MVLVWLFSDLRLFAYVVQTQSTFHEPKNGQKKEKTKNEHIPFVKESRCSREKRWG